MEGVPTKILGRANINLLTMHFKGSNSSAKYLIPKNVEVVILLDVLAYLMQSSN